MTATSKMVMALLALGAAGAATQASAQRDDGNHSLYSINQPVVQRTDFVIDLADQNGLPPGERSRLDAWFRSLGVGYGDRLAVDQPYPSRARIDVARLASEYGLLLGDSAPVTAGNVPQGAVRVIVSRSIASVPSCPRWSGSNRANATSPDYGCATNTNLAAMIADPSDLVLGQAGSGTSDGSLGAKAIKVYREAPTTGSKGLKVESTAGGGK